MRVTWLFFLVASVFIASLMAQQAQQALHLFGRVVESDGKTPTANVRVDLVCNARVIQHTNTRRNGEFDFDLGREQRSTEISAATAGNDPTETMSRGIGGIGAGGQLRTQGDGRFDLNNCSVRLTPKPGIVSNRIPLKTVSIFQSDVGIIVRREVGEIRGTTVSVNDLSAPKPAKKALNKANKILGKKAPDYAQAVAQLRLATEAYPAYASAWNQLGQTWLILGDRDKAVEALKESVQADEDFLPPAVRLTELALESRDWAAAKQGAMNLVELDQNVSSGHYYLGMARYGLGEYEQAAESLEIVERYGDAANYPQTYLMLGDILARRGDYQEASERVRTFLAAGAPSEQMVRQLEAQLSEWQKKGLITAPDSR